MKRPAFQFYPADWRNDAALRICSMGARGLWIEMICLMHLADPYGHLVAAGKPIAPAGLSSLVGMSKSEVTRWLSELKEQDVFSVTADGVIYSRRMVRDEQQRQEWGDRQRKHRNVTPDVTPDVTQPSRENHTLSSSSSSTSTSKAEPTPNPLAAAPPGVRPEVWAMWRKARGRKLTADAVALQTRQLEEYAAAGDDPNAVIEQSICNTWAGLFPLKSRVNGSPQSQADRRAEVAKAIYGNQKEKADGPADITGESKRVD